MTDFQYPVSLEAHQEDEDWENVIKRHHNIYLYSNNTEEEETSLETKAEEFEVGWTETIQNSGFLYYEPGPLTQPRTPPRLENHTIKRILSKASKHVVREEDQHEEDKIQNKTSPAIERRKKCRKLKRIVEEDQDEVLLKTRNANNIRIDISENEGREPAAAAEPVENTENRILRVRFRDPDATESSSDDNDFVSRQNRRNCIQEICIPIKNSGLKFKKLEANVERFRRNNLLESLLMKTPCPKKKRSKRRKRSIIKEDGIFSFLSSPLSVLNFEIPGPIPDFQDLYSSVGNRIDNFFDDCPEYIY